MVSHYLYLIPGIRQLQKKLNQLSSYVPPPPRINTDSERRSLKILLLHAHPNTVSSYSAAIAQQVEQSSKTSGHELRRVSLYSDNDDFQPKLTLQEHELQHARGQDLETRQLAPEIKEYIRLLQWCDTLILVYPTWWMNTPAALKGFFDRTLVHDICFRVPEATNTNSNQESTTSSTGLIPQLTNVTQIVGISTYGAPAHIVTLAGDNGRRMIANAIRPIMSPEATVTWLGLYQMDETTNVQRTEFLKQVHQLIQSL